MIKFSEQSITCVLLEVYRNIMTWATWTAAKIRDFDTQKFRIIKQIPSVLVQRSLSSNWEKMFICSVIQPLLCLLVFWMKSLLLTQTPCLLIFWPAIGAQFRINRLINFGAASQLALVGEFLTKALEAAGATFPYDLPFKIPQSGMGAPALGIWSKESTSWS